MIAFSLFDPKILNLPTLVELREKLGSLADKTIVVRCDFNVPVDDNGHITDHSRIIAHLPTIRFLLKEKARLILISHFGRPQAGLFEEKFSLRVVAHQLSKQLDQQVTLVRADEQKI